MMIGDKFCSICGGSAAAVDVWCCGKLVLNNFCSTQCGQPAAAGTAITVKEEAAVIKMEHKADKEEVIYTFGHNRTVSGSKTGILKGSGSEIYISD